MANVRVLELGAGEHQELVWGQAYGATPSYRRRCAIVLLKAQGLSNAGIAQQLQVSEVTVGTWITRYRVDKVAGLVTQAGRGGVPILREEDMERVREVVSQNRSRLSAAKAELEEELGKSFCQRTLERFVKKTAHATSASASVRRACQRPTTTRTKSSN